MKTIKFLLLSIAAVTLAACSNESVSDIVTPQTSNDEILLKSDIIATTGTRASSSLTGSQIPAGIENVGVYIYKTGTTDITDNYGYEGYLYDADGQGGLVLGTSSHRQYKPYYPSDGAKVDMYVYAPVNLVTINGFNDSQEIMVRYNQSTNADFINCDLVYGKIVNQAKVKTAVNVPMSHQFAKVVVNLYAEQGISEDVIKKAEVKLVNMQLNKRFNFATGVMSEPRNEPLKYDITMKSITDATLNLAAVVVPQTVENGSEFINITYGGATYVYNYDGKDAEEQPKDLVFESGKVYTFDVTVRTVGVTATTTVTDWTDGENKNGGAIIKI